MPRKRRLQACVDELLPQKRLEDFSYQKRDLPTFGMMGQTKRIMETDLRCRACTKNPGHRTFVSINHFNVNHLPPAYHDEDIAEYVRALSSLTAQVTTQGSSQEKPDLSSVDQSRHQNKDGQYLRTTLATGMVQKVKISSKGNADNDGICRCDECKESSTPKTQFAHVIIYTAANVVRDTFDDVTITCNLFFDKGERPDVCWGVVSLKQVLQVHNVIDNSRCEITFATHDLHLAARLEKMLRDWQNLRGKIMTKYLTTNSSLNMTAPINGDVPDNEQPLAIIVSHPHGCSKYVSIGHCISREELGRGLTRYSYTAATCPGSSGARLSVVGKAWWWFCSNHLHGGGSDATWEVSCSAPGSDGFK